MDARQRSQQRSNFGVRFVHGIANFVKLAEFEFLFLCLVCIFLYIFKTYMVSPTFMDLFCMLASLTNFSDIFLAHFGVIQGSSNIYSEVFTSRPHPIETEVEM